VACAGTDEAHATQFVLKLGGRLTRDAKAPGRPVLGAELNVATVTDAGLKVLAGLTQLQYLTLICTRVTGEGIAALREALPGA
jgi:hypothetical protein